MNNMQKILRPLSRRLKMMLGRGIINLIDDSKAIQEMQISLLANETRSSVQRFQNYGVSSHPHDGSEALAVFLGGSRDNGIILAVDDKRYRIKSLEKGEVVIYTDEGDKIHLKRGNNIEIQTGTLEINASSEIKMTAPEIKLNASNEILADTPLFKASGNIWDNYTTNSFNLAGMRNQYDSHRHSENDNGGPTDPPDNLMS